MPSVVCTDLQGDHPVVESDVDGLEGSQLLVFQRLDSAGQLSEQVPQHVHRTGEVDRLLLDHCTRAHVRVFCHINITLIEKPCLNYLIFLLSKFVYGKCYITG